MPSVTVKPVDLQLTLTPGHTKEVQSCPAQHEVPAQPPETPEKVKRKDVKPSPTQQEYSTKPPNCTEEVELSPVQVQVPVQPPEFPNEVLTLPSLHDGLTIHPPGHPQAHHSVLPKREIIR